MAFYKKAYNKKTEVYYPRAITIGTAINTDQIAEALADRSTVTKTDVKAVLTEMADVMSQYMAQGKSVKLEGLGSFRLGLNTKGVKNEEDFDFQTQLQRVKVNFIPETTYPASTGAATRSMVSNSLEWIEYDKALTTADSSEGGTPSEGGGEDPLG
ncbi:HU family DNA-binding protein [Bacteroides ndongoniae]|jgi:predicted histone-like DNA-binding protein|uniref:HU family DNA-binding protein n=1 Tax=Bacteroides ndongoniae TaxID=1903262 RepID=UPI0008D99405|nr:HU family DNA-binding protein [Bacteroides ndongoniae]